MMPERAEQPRSASAAERADRDAIIEVLYRWEVFEHARGPIQQADALLDLSGAMSDLSSWYPRCCEGGYFGQDHLCEKSGPFTLDTSDMAQTITRSEAWGAVI